MTLHSVKRFGLMPHTGKGKALEVGRQALEQLEAAGAAVVMEPEAAAALGRTIWRCRPTVGATGCGRRRRRRRRAAARGSRVMRVSTVRCWPSTSGGSAF